MTPEERQLLAGLFDRTRAASSQPRDREAEALIADAVREQPYAPYLLAQTVIVQEQALHASSDRLQQLEAQIRDLQQQAAAPQGGSFLSGLGGLFGGAPAPSTETSASVPSSGVPAAGASPWGRTSNAPQPQAPAGWPQPAAPQPGGPWQAAAPAPGGSFLKGALGAAAGVAGGVLLADSLRGLFGGHNNMFGIGSGFGGGLNPGGETVINNYYGNDAAPQVDTSGIFPSSGGSTDYDDAADDAASDAGDSYDDGSTDA